MPGINVFFYAAQFYDTTNQVRKELHKKYIQQCFNSLADNSNVIQFVSEEYTGPLLFVQFWLDCIRAIPGIKSNQNKIGLSTTKDVQDAILANPKYAPMIDVIDIKYWHYQPDGSVYAPEGGKNLAPRQWARLLKPKTASFEQVYRAVKEYRTKYPDKAVMFSADGYDRFGWAVFMGGGSLPVLPKETTPALLSAATKMTPSVSGNNFILSDNKDAIIYLNRQQTISLEQPFLKGIYKVQFFSTETGQATSTIDKVRLEGKIDLTIPVGAGLVWYRKL